MTQDPDIKYRRDGSIDTEHYMRIGRQARSEEVLRLFSKLKPPASPPLPRKSGIGFGWRLRHLFQ